MQYDTLATTDYGNVLDRYHFMDKGIVPLWSGIPRISGPAFTVKLAPGDNLMLHAAIYEAPSGSVIVIDGGDSDYAVAGGNVCAVAQERGVAGFIVDGVIRDLGEITQMQFPVYARGIFPVPGKKQVYQALGQTITCGGIRVNSGDILVADNEGIAVLEKEQAEDVYIKARRNHELEKSQTLAEWQEQHQAKIANAIEQAKKQCE